MKAPAGRGQHSRRGVHHGDDQLRRVRRGRKHQSQVVPRLRREPQSVQAAGGCEKADVRDPEDRDFLRGDVRTALVGEIAAGVSGTNPTARTETAQEKQKAHRDYQAYLAAKALNGSLRNPDSLSFEQILVNSDGSVICMTYRAKNGFGGMNVEHVVFKDGTRARVMRVGAPIAHISCSTMPRPCSR
jgi:hypothetical protein